VLTPSAGSFKPPTVPSQHIRFLRVNHTKNHWRRKHQYGLTA